MTTLEYKPTRSETSLAERQRMVQLHAQGWSYQRIADDLGVNRWTVLRWVQRYRADGEAGLAYRTRRPHRPHPQTTDAAVVTRIHAIRTAHPGWGARLIHRQLRLDGIAQPPAQSTIARWLSRLGFALVRPAAHKPLGWQPSTPQPHEVLWEVDFKQKGGPGI